MHVCCASSPLTAAWQTIRLTCQEKRHPHLWRLQVLSKLTPYQRIHALRLCLDRDTRAPDFVPWTQVHPKAYLNRLKCTHKAYLYGPRCAPKPDLYGPRCAPKAYLYGPRCVPKTDLYGLRSAPKAYLYGLFALGPVVPLT